MALALHLKERAEIRRRVLTFRLPQVEKAGEQRRGGVELRLQIFQ
jgi:hypothetical protein